MTNKKFKQAFWVVVTTLSLIFWGCVFFFALAAFSKAHAEEKVPTSLFYEWSAEDGTLIDFNLYFDQYDKSDLSQGMIATGTELSTGRIAKGRWDFTDKTYVIDLNDGVNWYGYEFFKSKFEAR